MLPKEFKERMENLLGSDSVEFFLEIETNPPKRAFRVNEIKLSSENFEQLDTQIERKKALFPKSAYYTEEQFIGFSPAHHAGMIYVQDPSAMATVFALEPKKGMRVLDSCSAPGGKTAQLAQAVGDGGVVVANEYDSKRCRVLQGNIERMGARNTVVLNLDTKILAEAYRSYFDFVLCDAPCSGEGMFRKNSDAIDNWSLQNVKICAKRQNEIIENVAQCVRDGGYLLYSTCTFSLEENEMLVDSFLSGHTEFSLCPVSEELSRVTADGINFDGCQHDMKLTRRYYPHVSQGEGQFIALMRKKLGENGDVGDAKPKKAEQRESKRRSKEEISAIKLAYDFLSENLIEMPQNELVTIGNFVYLKPDIHLTEFGVISAGVCVGEVQKSRFVPHHQLFSAYGNQFRRKIDLPYKSKELQDYLLGLEIDADTLSADDCKPDGYCAILVEGVALGGGKVSAGKCKNHYPKGLRNTKKIEFEEK